MNASLPRERFQLLVNDCVAQINAERKNRRVGRTRRRGSNIAQISLILTDRMNGLRW